MDRNHLLAMEKKKLGFCKEEQENENYGLRK